MSEPSSSPELVPLREINADADDARVRRQSEDAQSSGTDTGEEVPEHLPFVERAVNFPLLCANIRNVIQGVLDVIPMPASVRTYLKIRWFRLFIATLLFLLIAVIASGVLLFVVESSPEPTPIPDPFAYWATDLGPNDRTTIRLPNIIAPITYRLFLNFHMSDTSRPFRYEGRVAITFEVLNVFENGDTFLIHAHKHLDVDFKNFVVTDDLGYVERVCDSWETFPYVDEKGVLRTKDDSAGAAPEKWKNFGQYELPNITRLDDDTLEVKLSQQLEERTQKIILIHFTGTMRDNPPGIFARKIENSDDYWVATQFQPSLARVAFPCFDEPEFRASFYLSIAHPPKYVALSNMVAIPDRASPERASPDVENVWSTFTPTPTMPAYLFGFVVGPFKSLGLNRTKTGPRIKMFALDQKDLIHRSVFTANVTLQAMAFAAKYFELEYQMNKLYAVALPTTQPIDSECWGLILFREEAIFLNMTTASVDMLEKVARHVIHYIIHQWIGNIVGPSWWDDLWATEALVRYIEDDFIETIFPDWHVKENFGTQVIGGALNVDVLDKSHAVAALPRIPYYPVTMFDCLTSVKGAALFRMMDLIKPGSMKKAVRHHLRLRGGRQVVTNVLFQDIHYAVYPPNTTAEEGQSIVKVMAKWTRESGYPLVTLVRYSGSSDVSLFQELFDPHIMISQQSLESHEISEKKCHKPGRHHRSEPSLTAWSLPIDLWTLNGSSLAQIDGFWLTTDYHRVCGGIPPRSRYILANYDQKGFFRVNYDEGNWQLIGHEMLHNPKVFSQITRAQLIDDAMAMAKVGRLNFVEALEMPLALLHQGVLGELTAGDVGMFERAMRAVADVHDCLRGSKMENDMLDYMRLLAASQWAAVDPPQRRKLERVSGHVDILAQRTSLLLQEQAIFWACYTAMTECTDWSVSLVREWQETHPTDTNAVEEHYSNTYCAAIRYGPDSFFDFLWDRYNREGLSETHKQEILWSLLCTKKRKKIMDVFGGLPGKRDLVEDTMLLWKKMEGRHIAAWYAFKYERSTWDNVHHRMYNSSFFNQIIIAITSALTTPSDLEEIQRFRVAHNQSLWDVQDLLEENVHNIRRRLYFRAIIEESLQAGLDEILPLAKAVKMQTDAARSPTPAPTYGYTEGKLEPATPHPV